MHRSETENQIKGGDSYAPQRQAKKEAAAFIRADHLLDRPDPPDDRRAGELFHLSAAYRTAEPERAKPLCADCGQHGGRPDEKRLLRSLRAAGQQRRRAHPAEKQRYVGIGIALSAVEIAKRPVYAAQPEQPAQGHLSVFSHPERRAEHGQHFCRRHFPEELRGSDRHFL